MKSTKYIYLLLLFGLLQQTVIAQNLYDIKLKYQQLDNPEIVCYEIQLRSPAAETYYLGGQNYRLYYNADSLIFNENSSQSLLPNSTYSAFILNENIINSNIEIGAIEDVLGNGTIGFLNFSVDLIDTENGGEYLHAIGNWVSTAEICFDLTNNNTTAISDIIWARPNLSAEVGTAFVEVSEWISADEMRPAQANEYIDGDLINAIKRPQIPKATINIYPNPFEDEFIIETTIRGSYTIRLWSSEGQLMYKEEEIISDEKWKLNIQNLAAGIYYFQLNNGTDRYIQMVAKQ
jgi:hypothetical protein